MFHGLVEKVTKKTETSHRVQKVPKHKVVAEDRLTTKKAGKAEVNIHSMLVNRLDTEQDAASETAVRRTLKTIFRYQ